MSLYDSRKQNQSAFNILIAWFILSHDELGKFFFILFVNVNPISVLISYGSKFTWIKKKAESGKNGNWFQVARILLNVNRRR